MNGKFISKKDIGNVGAGAKYISLFYGGLLLLCTGVIYSWSIFVAPLEIEFGWSRSLSLIS